jgi:hypothetical protein
MEVGPGLESDRWSWLSCFRHLARRFWNQTCSNKFLYQKQCKLGQVGKVGKTGKISNV